ncbi:MAG: cell division protein FtsW [Acidobacteria bacterium]|nr:cell division protein FtsW [Acidobacteriota bacterium]
MSTRTKTDWLLFGAVMMILAFGLVMVYSASSVVAEILYKKGTWEFAARQLLMGLAGVTLMLLLKRMDYKKLEHPLWIFLALSVTILLLMGVIPADPRAHRWYRLPGVGQFQPSEIAKPVLVLFLAWFVGRREELINSKYTIYPTGLVVGGLTLLIGYGDLGTAAVLLAPAMAVFYVAGVHKRYFMLTLTLVAVLGVGFIVQKPYRLIRVLSYVGLTEEKIHTTPQLQWLGPVIANSKATRDSEHQPKQAKIAVGSGGLTGVGLGQSNQKLGFLPEAHTDFIFGVVGEETGLVGCVLLLCGYLVVFWRGLRLFWMAQDSFGRYLALGCVTLFTAQALFNMSVVLSIAPTKGIPLPLVSSGGSALVCTLATIGLLMSVSDRAT